ncbi:flagellar attachment zone protein [Leishmania donovani]|uniref:Flagellar attachment zone protein n=1 Tax=Leishmania donovani TaxID=5661 RepID=A0A504XWS1_LEIDO|nr:hypothetical protein CGC20_2170 [Leishmania donovani]CAJ1992413.1 flagellar attachment zone protein [Leishmania donovani]
MLARYLDPSVHPLRVGQVVAYDYLHAAKTWQWTLGTVREIKDYTAVVQQWGLHTGDIDTLRSILLKEVDTENGRMKNYHDMLAIAREKLASIRRSNEDRVSHVRGHFDKAREKVELIDEVDLRKVTAQAAPSPVAVAVLKAVWAVAKCDPTAVEFYEWADVQLEYRKPAALDEIAKTDVLAKLYPSAESLQQSLEQDPKLNYKAAARDSPVVASLHAWVITALAYQQAYNLLAHDKRIQEQNDAIAAAIAGMKACRAKIAKLKDELSSKDTAALPGQVTSFTRTSVLVTIPLSAVISPVNVDTDVKRCVLTKDEVEQIPIDAKITRYAQKQKLAITGSHLLDQYAAATTTHIYVTELEDRLFFFQHYMASALRDAQTAAVDAHQRLAVSLHELEAFRQKRHDAKKARAAEPELADADGVEPSSGPTSSRSPTGRAAPRGQSAAPRGTASQQHKLLGPAYQSIDPATIANEPLYAVTIEEYKAKDAAGERAMDEAERMADEVQRLAVELEDAKAAADKLAEELAAKDEELAAHRQKRHDARQARASDPALAAADAVAPRSGKGAASPHVGAVQRQAVDPATVPVAPAVIAEEPLYVATAEELQHVRDFADQLAEELEAFRQKRHDAKKARAAEPELADADGVEPSSGPTSSRSPTGRAAPRGQSAAPRGTASQQHKLLGPAYQSIDPATIANEPLYAVTIEEYKAKDAAGERAMDEAERMADEVQRLAVELEDAKAAADKLAEELAAKDEELAAHRQKRHDARQARASDPALAAADAVAPRSGKGAASPHVGAVQRQAVDPATVPVAPAVIAEEPLYVATAEELQHVRDFADQLAEELEAFRQKRHDAKKARAAEPELADADGVEPSSGPTSSRSPTGRAAPRGQSAAPRGTASQQHKLLGPAYQSIDPATIANEPLYAVTIEEYKAKDAAGERAMDEAERMADEVQRLAVELEDAKAAADKLAEELAAKDEELAAHRQKRHDARQARASDPALAAADAVAPRSGKGAASPHVGAVQRQAVDPATVPVAPAVIAEEPLYVATAEELQHVRDFADQLAEELEAFRQKRHDAKKARAAEPELADADGVEPSSGPTSSRSPTGRAAPRGQSAAPRGTASQQHKLLGPAYQSIDPATIANEPLYAVTIEEYKAKDAAGERAMDEAERMADEVQRLAVELEDAKAAADKLAEELAAKDEELAAHRQKRHDARQARASDPALAAADAVAPRSGKGAASPHVGAVQRQAVDPATVPVAPAVIAEEPLYVATAEELQHVRDFADQLAEELEAFRQKRHDAKKARAAEPELADADGVEPSSGPTSSRSPTGRAAPRGQSAAPRGTASQQHKLLGPAYQSIDPATIANEPLYAVTIEEYKAKDAAGERAMDEAERMADEVQRLAVELEDAKAAADKLAEELAAKDEELAAHRQKRHDARQARASDPALAAADAVAPRSGKGAASPHVGAVQRQAVDPATVPVAPAVIAEEPLYVATAEELQHVRDFADQAAHDATAREAEVAGTVENLRNELDDVREMNAKLEDEVFALKEQLSDAEDAYKKLAGALVVAEDERQELCDDLEAALDELEQKKDEYDELLGNLEEVQGLLEAADVAGRTAVEALEQRNRDMADLQGELANALDASKENENLRALLDAKEREIDRLKEYNSFWTDTVGTGKQKVTHRLTKIFDGDWTRLMRHRPEALKAAFVIDSSNACHVPGDQIVQVDFDHD